MHGIIFSQFNEFVTKNYNYDTLTAIKKDAGLAGKFHISTKSHPDEDILALVTSACKLLKVNKEELLEGFGRFLAPGLLKTYNSYIETEWDCMDLIEHVEKTMHKVVRRTTPDASPPKLVITREGPDEIILDYTSERKMISLGIGIIEAIGEHFKTKINIEKLPLKNGTRLKITR